MSRTAYALVAAAMAIGLVASGCSSSPNSATKTTSPASATQLQSLIPTPANTQRTVGGDRREFRWLGRSRRRHLHRDAGRHLRCV